METGGVRKGSEITGYGAVNQDGSRKKGLSKQSPLGGILTIRLGCKIVLFNQEATGEGRTLASI